MKVAIPVSYLDPRSGIGSVSVVSSEGPPLSVKPWTKADGENKICIELEDLIKTVEREMGLTDDEVMRLCMHLSDARKLTHNLIYALAQSGDRIATRLQIFLDDTMAQIRAMDEMAQIRAMDEMAQIRAMDEMAQIRAMDEKVDASSGSFPKPLQTCLCTLNHVVGKTGFSLDFSWPQPVAINKYAMSNSGLTYAEPLPPQNTLKLSDNFTIRDGVLAVETGFFSSDVLNMLRVIRKYAELLQLLVRFKDRHGVLKGFDYKSVLHPYVAEDPIVL